MKKQTVGGVSFESERNAYRGSVTILGTRHRTGRHATQLGARRALNALVRELTVAKKTDKGSDKQLSLNSGGANGSVAKRSSRA